MASTETNLQADQESKLDEVLKLKISGCSASAAYSPVQEDIYVVIGIDHEPRRGRPHDAAPDQSHALLALKTGTLLHLTKPRQSEGQQCQCTRYLVCSFCNGFSWGTLDDFYSTNHNTMPNLIRATPISSRDLSVLQPEPEPGTAPQQP